MSDAANLAALQDKVNKDNRVDRYKKELIDKKLTFLKYKPAVVKTSKTFTCLPTVRLINQRLPPVRGITENAILFSFGSQTVKAGDWLNFVRSVRNSPDHNATYGYPELFKEFVRKSANEYYRKNLHLYDPAYAKQIKEFKEANLLFGIMEKNVWGKANTDTNGLQQYYNLHKSKYTWPPSADAIVVACNSQKLAESMQQKIKDSLHAWRQIAARYGNDVVADSARFELGQLPVVDRTNFTAGLITAPVKNENDGTYTFSYVINVYPEPGQRNFDDARGMVITDYQQVLEERWIADLKKKYPVTVNEAVFNTIK